MIDKLKQRVKELFESKTIGVFIGYEKGDNQKLARPVMITSANEVDRLIYDHTSMVMLSKYLLKKEVDAYGKRGIIASLSNIRAIATLIQENQINRDKIYIIAALGKGETHTLYDERMEINSPTTYAGRDNIDQQVAELMKLSAAQRWAFWKKELSKCIKCYACRQICPLCYCNRCIADKNQPQWIPVSPLFAGDFMWNLTRAYHLAGRCVDCGECERACPVGIPLMLLNKMIYNNVKNNFNYEAGLKTDVPLPLTTYHQDDKENFIV